MHKYKQTYKLTYPNLTYPGLSTIALISMKVAHWLLVSNHAKVVHVNSLHNTNEGITTFHEEIFLEIIPQGEAGYLSSHFRSYSIDGAKTRYYYSRKSLTLSAKSFNTIKDWFSDSADSADYKWVTL